MRINRRCGVSPICFVVLFLFALISRFSTAQVALVHTGTRSAGTGSAGYSSDYGAATTVMLNAPSYIAFDSNGNQYLSDTLNNCVRKIDVSGNVTTVAGLAVSGQSDTCNPSSNAAPTAAQGLYRPTGLAIDSANRLYIADSMHNCVRVLTSGGTGVTSLTTVAGTCGAVSAASVTPMPNGLTIDSNNSLYIALQDSSSAAPVSQVVRHAGASDAATVCLVAGAPSTNVSASCPGISNSVMLSNPSALAIGVGNNLFIADTGNQCVREIAGLTTQQTAVGQCLNDGTGSATTSLRNPYGLAISPTQALFISQSNPDNIVSYTPGSNSLTLVAGLPSGIAGIYLQSQDGKSALNLPLNGPRGIAFDPLSHIFVADALNNIVRELSDNLQFANTPVGSQSAAWPITFAIDQPVNLSVAAGSDFSITGTTCSGALTPATASSAPTTCQVFVQFTPTRPGLRRSALKLTDALSHTAVLEGLQGTGSGALSLFTPGSLVTAANDFATPAAVATDTAGNVYVLQAGETATSASLVTLSPGGDAPQTIIAAGHGLVAPTAIATDAAGNWFVANSGQNSIARFNADGSSNTSYVTGLDTPTAVAVDGFGNLFVAQAGSSHNVIEIYATGARRVIAGSGSNASADGIAATNAGFVLPSALTFGLNGKLYVADQIGHRVYAIDQNGIIHIVAGTGSNTTTNAGKATGTALVSPISLATDAAGDLYIADQAAALVYVVYAGATGGNNMAVALDGSGLNGAPAINGLLSIALDANGNLFAVNAAANSVLELSYSNPALNFGTVNTGTTSTVHMQQVGNIGTDNLDVTSPFSTSDTHFALDTNSTTCGTSLPAGSVCSLGFTFTPTANVAYTATSVLASNSPNSPQAIQLTGKGNMLVSPTVTLPAESQVYGQPFNIAVSFNGTTAAPTGTITFTAAGQTICSIDGYLGSATTCHAQSTLGVGSYPVAFSYSGDSNYSATTGTTVLTVTPAPLVITVAPATRIYAAANPAFHGDMTGAATGDIILLAYSTNATIASGAGTYPIAATLTPVGTANLSNYIVTNTPGSLTITPSKALIVTVDSATRVYGTANPTFTGTVTGILNNDNLTVTYSTPATSASSAGRYMIAAAVSGTAAANYAPTITVGALTISPATTTTTLTTSNLSATMGDNIIFTAKVVSPASTVTGTVNFYDGTTLLSQAPLTSGATIFSISTLAVGAHSITAVFQASTNFTTSGSAPIGESIAQMAGGFVLAPVQATQYIRGSGTTTFQINLKAVGGFAGKVALACSGLPADSTCNFTDANPTLTAGSSITTTMTVTSAAINAKLQPASLNPASFAPLTAAAVFPFELTGLGVCFAGLRRKQAGSQKRKVLIILLFTLGMIGLTGCGAVNTPVKTYTISVTGTSMSFPAASQTTSVVLSVGQQ